MLQLAFYRAGLHHWPDENVAVIRKKQKENGKKWIRKTKQKK